MTQTRISSSLEAIIARTTSNLNSKSITTSYRDRLALELLSDRSTFAYQLIEMLVGECGINIILRRVERAIATNPMRELDMPETHYETICSHITDRITTPCISTVHILHFIADDSSTALSAELSNYGILSEDIDEALCRLTT